MQNIWCAGYYKLSAKIAMMTRFPDLVELEGENRIVQADAYGEDVRGFTEFLGVTIVNETSMVGVQRSKTTISQINSDRDGQAIEVRGMADGLRRAVLASLCKALLRLDTRASGSTAELG